MRLAEALKAARRSPERSDLFGGIEQAVIGHFAAVIEQVLEARAQEIAQALTARLDVEREGARKASEASIASMKGEVAAAVQNAVQAASRQIQASIKVPAPQITEVVKPVERVIETVTEKAPVPLTSINVVRDEDGDIAQLNTNKGRFKVIRDEDGLITGIKAWR